MYSVKDLCKFLYRLLESEDPDHDDEFYHGRKATAEGKYPPGKCFNKKKISDIKKKQMKSRKDTSRVRSPKDQESGKPWLPWQCRATLQLSTYILLSFHPQFSYQCSRVPDPEKTY